MNVERRSNYAPKKRELHKTFSRGIEREEATLGI
jgi:hypothetical protein